MTEQPIQYIEPLPSNLDWLKKTYFSNPDKRLQLKKGDVLMRQNEYNDRLYLVRSGELRGYLKNTDGNQVEAFKAVTDKFVGVHSFFSRTFTSLTTVKAMMDTVVEYIDRSQQVVDDGRGISLVEQFMPVMVTELVHRQQRIQNIALEKERALMALIHSEKMASLGQISAGIAHELNNAVSVLKRNSEWLSQRLIDLINEKYPEHCHFFTRGLQKGRHYSSREIRSRSKALRERFNLNDEAARKAAQAGLTDDEIKNHINDWSRDIDRINYHWEIGATLNDMMIAAEHAIHVVRSIKALGAQHPERKPGIDVNESIREALTLLASPLRKINLDLNLEPLPLIYGNKGELVQMFLNVMKNACESMLNSNTTQPNLDIHSRADNGDVIVTIGDNGPGIPQDIRPKIFEPTLTTKKDSQTVGLGLGLTIVKRLMDSYGGDISVESNPGRTVFNLQLPIGGEHGET